MATTTPTDSWLFTDTSRAALFDEIVKIGEAAKPDAETLAYYKKQIQEAEQRGFNNALKTGLAGAAGVGAGYLAGEGATRLIDKIRPGTVRPRKPVPGRGSFQHRMLTIGLPIGAGVGATLWSRALQKRKQKLQGDDSR
jgi:hypothetical protein